MKKLLSRQSDFIPKVIGRLAFLTGIFIIVANLLPRVGRKAGSLESYLPFYVTSTSLATSILTGFAMILIARGLIRRKHRAWLLMLGILTVNIISNQLRSQLHPAQTIVVAILVILLIYYRKNFYAVSDPATKYSPLYTFSGLLILVIVTGLGLLYFRHGSQIPKNTSFKDIFLTVIEGLVGVAGPVHLENPRLDDTVSITLGAFGIFTILFPLSLYFRKTSVTPKLSDSEVEEVKKLIKWDSDQDSLGYFATRRDKSVIWSNNKKAGIAYRVQSGVLLASGDPFGEFSLWPEVIEKFLEMARKYAWTPAVMGASDLGGEVWVKEADMLAIDIGDEAIINVSQFTLEGRPMANVRQMVNRIKRKGYYTTTSRFVDLSQSDQEKLRYLARHWRYGAAERGFSMSMDRFGELGDMETIITVARQGDEIKGLLYFVPWIENRLSLDRMQRDKDSDPGVNDLMIVETALWAKENNITHVSLNFAAFRSIFERAEKINAGPILRFIRNTVRFFSNWFQVESLYRFNAKFQPEWRTRYVLYPKAADIVRVGWAALRAEQFISSFRKRSIKNN